MNELELARKVLNLEVVGEKVGLLMTADERGRPHATWMATYAFVDKNQVITLASPDSRKAKNLAENPQIEWLFTSDDYEYLIYLTGRGYVEKNPKNFKKHWKLLPDKRRAYFLESYNSPPGFAMIRTEVDSVTFVIPSEMKSVDLDFGDLID